MVNIDPVTVGGVGGDVAADVWGRDPSILTNGSIHISVYIFIKMPQTPNKQTEHNNKRKKNAN